MKNICFLTYFVLSFGCDSVSQNNSNTLDVGDAISISLQPDGNYSVECKNGSSEIVSSDALNAGEVCLSGSLSCYEDQSGFHTVYSSLSGKLGYRTKKSDCLSLIKSSVYDLVCTPERNGFYHLRKISTGKIFGKRSERSDCIRSIENPHNNWVCVTIENGFYSRFKITEGWGGGRFPTFAKCLEDIKNI